MKSSEKSKIKQGSSIATPNYGPASGELASFSALKWLIGFRSLVFVSIVALLLGTRWARLGTDLELGVLSGILNMWLVMWANERFLDGRVHRSQRSVETFARLMAMGALLAFMMYWGPWWSIGIALSGFYIPTLLQLSEVTRRYRTGKM